MKTKLTVSILALAATLTPAFAGNFNGLLRTAAVSSAPAEPSLLTITTSATSAVSGSLKYAAKSYAFTATLDAAGHADITIPRTGRPLPPPLALSIQSDTTLGFVADVSAGPVIASGTSAPCPFSAAAPTPAAGRYVQMVGMSVPRFTPYPSEVGGLTVAGTGAVVVTGKLSNGKAFSASAWLTSGGFPLFGIATTTPRASASADVALTSAGAFTSPGVVCTIPGVVAGAFLAERWTPPALNTPVRPVDVTMSPNLSVWAMAGPRSLIAGYDMTMSASSRVTDASGVIPALATLAINKSTGLLSGRFDDGGVYRSYTGAIFPSLQRGVGVWSGGTMQIFTY